MALPPVVEPLHVQPKPDSMQHLWKKRWQPTAIVTMADAIAIGVLKAAQELEVEIPGEMSLMGYDGITASALTCPPLTTIRQPVVEKGRVAAQLLVENIEPDNFDPKHILLPTELIARISCAPIVKGR